MAKHREGLTSKQQRAITAMIGSRINADAAEAVGVTERTLYLWMRQAEFREALEAAQRETEGRERELVKARVRKLMPDFLDRMEQLFQSANESVQVAALKLYLEFRKSEKDAEIERRIAAVEARLFGQASATSTNGAYRC
jgi:hypothetical protein